MAKFKWTYNVDRCFWELHKITEGESRMMAAIGLEAMKNELITHGGKDPRLEMESLSVRDGDEVDRSEWESRK